MYRNPLPKLPKGGHLLQGLDQIKKELDKELKGLQAVAKKQGTGLGSRLSRFLLLSADGSDRFYRQAESIFAEHKERLAGALLSADSAVLGQAFSKKQQPVKALLIKDRKCLEAFLTAASRT
jgi:hypothetical protein